MTNYSKFTKRSCNTLVVLILIITSYSQATSAQAVTLSNEQLTEKIIELEKENTSLKKLNKKQFHSMSSKLKDMEEKMQFQGFLTVGATKINEKDIDYANLGFSQHIEYRPDSLVGLQATVRHDDKTDVVTQMVAEGGNDFSPEIRWAYIRHRINDDLQIRGGRIKTPFYYYSETLDVGFSYLWTRPPPNIYISTLSAFEGVDLSYRFNVGNSTHRWQFATGNLKENLSPKVKIDASNGFFTNIESNFNLITTRLGIGYTKNATVTIEGVGEHTFPIIYLDYAVIYEASQLQAMIEATQSEVSNEDYPLLADSNLYLALLSYRFNNCVYQMSCAPYLSYSFNYTTSETDKESAKIGALEIPNYHVPTNGKYYQLGVRFNLTSKVSLKTEIANMKQSEFGANSNFSRKPPSGGVNVYSVVLDAIF